MKHSVLQKAAEFIKRNKDKKAWRRATVCLSVLVLFCTVYALMLPAITMEKPRCGLEEHIHTDECYEWVQADNANLVTCSIELLNLHEHEDSCYDEAGQILCGYADFFVHTHDTICYDEAGNLRCDFPEIKAHEHDDSCYERSEESGEIVDEDVLHSPSNAEESSEPSEQPIGPDVMTEDSVSDADGLICEEEEIILHTHSEACRDENGSLTCGQLEILEHKHTESCFPSEKGIRVLVCELPEHQHTDACMDSYIVPCGYADFVVHTHDENCYDQYGELWCELEEIEEHVHDDLCYMVMDIIDEDEFHEHTADCYGVSKDDENNDDSDDENSDGEDVGVHSPSNAEENTDNEGSSVVVGGPSSETSSSGGPGVHSPSNAEDDSDEESSAAEAEGPASVSSETDEPGVQTPSNADKESDVIVAGGASSESSSSFGPGMDGPGVQSPSNADEAISDIPSDENNVQTPSNAEKLVLICGYSDIREVEKKLICDLQVVELHTHDETCWDLDGSLNCGYMEIQEHQHTEECMFVASETGVISCMMTVHEHTDECYDPVFMSEQEIKQIQNVISRIDQLPDEMAIETKLGEYEAAEDMEGYEQYFMETSRNALTAYVYYQELTEEQQEKVTNSNKLFRLEWLWSAQTMEIKDEITVCQVNKYTEAVTSIAYGGTVGEKMGAGMSYFYWDAVIVEKNAAGQLYISEYITADADKRGYAASTADGFVLLLYNESLNVSVGDSVTVNFDYKNTSGYNAYGYGTVSFGQLAEVKASKDNTNKLDIVDAADTSELIELNLYDYGSNINNLYKDNKKYPGFQQDAGQLQVYSTASSNFGNNITSDLDAGIAGITVKGGTTINATDKNDTANRPIEGMMYPSLKDGYPALKDGTSLDYLFSNSAYATKINDESINGLFQHNETTGAYTYNSRINHAQYNDDDTFTLYKQIISSNYAWYPFGNFLPFNDIVYQSAQASTIDRAYLEMIANSAQAKANRGDGDEYASLASSLSQWIAKMDSVYPGGWGAEEAILEYFNAGATVTGKAITIEEIASKFKAESGLDLLPNLYSIDYDEPTDFFFGMEMKMNLMQPKGGLTGNDGKQPMVFYFTGDDDVWVYIDGKLFLDLSGIHRHVGGEIDFVNGLVKYYNLNKAGGDVSTSPYKTLTFKQILGSEDGLNEKGTFEDYSTHQFSFYYIERGAGSGVCRLNFNFPLLKENAISVTKELSIDDPSQLPLLGNPDFKFQILKADADGKPTEDLFIPSGISYDIYENGKKLEKGGITGDHGIFTLKAGQTAAFSGIKENTGKYYVRELLDEAYFSQFGIITVDGNSVTKDAYTDVEIGQDQFSGIVSPVKDVSEGTTIFDFDNQIAVAQLGSLNISKELITYPPTDVQKSFDFYVTLDEEPLPVGTTYTVLQKDGTTITKTIEASEGESGNEGIITINSGETATISKIIAGTKFEVTETEASSGGYAVTYEVRESGSDAAVSSNTSAVGIVKLKESDVSVKITNAEPGTKLNIPVSKTIANPDGQNHTFQFGLIPVKYEGGQWIPIEGKTADVVEITTAGTSDETPSSAKFDLYYQKDITETTNFHYKLYEIADSTASSEVNFDTTEYIIEVEVTVSGDSVKVLTAEVKNVWVDGVVVTPFESASFSNTLVRDLTIAKELAGGASREFEFELRLKNGETPLTGTYMATKHTEGASVSEPIADETITIKFVDGKAAVDDEVNVKLMKDQSLQIHGIPYGTSWEVTEVTTDGYRVSYQVGEGTPTAGSNVSGILNDHIRVTFINKSDYELPKTGGFGTTLYTLGGLFLMLLAVCGFLVYNKNAFRKEDE